MCTAITYKTKDHYFGRNLDLEYSYNEAVTITPRRFPFKLRKLPTIEEHYAIIGISAVIGGYPLYYDAVNEKGLGIAGLNFPENAVYMPYKDGCDNVAPFEFIPWILGQCATVDDAIPLLEKINFVSIDFRSDLPLTPLHWIISDQNRSVTVEATKDGVRIYDNPIGVLTNNPTFDIQIFNLNNYMHLSPNAPENNFSDKINLNLYSNGMGALGLPGDLSSQSRFVRAAFTKLNSVSESSEEESVGQFFHILDSVAHTRGCVKVNGKYEITVYSSCCNTDKGIYYYTTYENRCISAVDMRKENLEGDSLASYYLTRKEKIVSIN